MFIGGKAFRMPILFSEDVTCVEVLGTRKCDTRNCCMPGPDPTDPAFCGALT
jgi:hypothetical protein